MTRKAISTDTAPAALGPYSQAIVANGFVFCSGTAGIDPATGLPGDGIEAQTELALHNLEAILTATGHHCPPWSRPPSSTPTSRTSRPSTRSTRASCPTRRQPAPHRPTSRCHAACSSRSTLSPCFRLHRSSVTRQNGRTGEDRNWAIWAQVHAHSAKLSGVPIRR